MRRSVLSVVVAGLVVALAPACSSSKDVPEASCQACSSASYTEADCQTWGAASGCESSAFVASPASGCSSGCSFKNCSEPPRCGVVIKDAGSSADAAVDPACAKTTNGLWSTSPPCTDTSTVTINGAPQYACKCTGSCPCNFKCGSIALSVGGTISNVCAP